MTENIPVSQQSSDSPQKENRDTVLFDRNLLIHYEQRIQLLEADVQALKGALQAQPDIQESEIAQLREKVQAVDGLHNKIREVALSSAESNRLMRSVEKRVTGVKSYATSGIAVSVLVFSILLILSVLIR